MGMLVVEETTVPSLIELNGCMLGYGVYGNPINKLMLTVTLEKENFCVDS